MREKWSEVNRKRLEYTVVITPAFSYPRRDGGADEETEGEVRLEEAKKQENDKKM